MSSLKMTFSLTSLIFLIALGLVFVGVPVIADDGGTAIPAGGDTANHDEDGHADQETANTAENDNPDHKHPQIMISAKDSDAIKAGIQVIPTAEIATVIADPASGDHLSIEVPVEFTIPKNSYVGTTANRPAADTLSDGATSASGVSFIGNESGGTVSLGTFALKADSTYVITAIATVQLADDGDTETTNKAQREAVLAADTPLEVKIMVANNVIRSSDTRGDYMGQGNLAAEMTFTLITTAVTEKTAFTVTGTPSVTDEFMVTFTADEADAVLTEADIMVDGGTIIGFGKDPFPPTGKTVYDVRIRPNLHARMVSVTIKDTAATAKPAEGDDGMVEVSIGEATITDIAPMPADANDEADFEVIFTFNRALPTSLELEDLSIGTMNSATDDTMNDMMDGDEANDTVTDAMDPMFLGTPNRVPGETMKWRVTVSPKMGSNTIVGLSESGMDKFTYGTDVEALTVMKKVDAPTPGAITVTYDADTMTATLTGTMPANPFASISRLNDDGTANYPDLQRFFDIGGTIDLHDDDDTDENNKNSREVVISEILWGLDRGAAGIDRETQWQFIELYNTTGAALDITGWTLVFSEGRPSDDKIDVDQVSNRPPFGLGFDFDIGKSGRVTGTEAVDPDSAILPENIVSMYRDIAYDTVEKVKDDGTPDPDRAGQLKGIPSGNDKTKWLPSQRRDPNTPTVGTGMNMIQGNRAARWIYASRDARHYVTTDFLVATDVPSTPFRINEIGNDTGSDNDWVELYNVMDEAKPLENYQLTAVTAQGTDTELFDFAGNKYNVPGKGFIVIATRHPQYTDLATGKDVSLADDLQDPKGLTHLYVVKPVNLPDDGKFTLILRSAHDKEKTKDNVIDVAASPEGGFADVSIASKLWPLVGSGAPGNIKGDIKNFAAGKVYQRDTGDGRGGDNFSVAGFSGIGYDIKAEVASTNHGTPGYANTALQANMAGLTDGVIKISEIMVDVGDSPRRKLPQWIELHNSSKTLGVNLADWKIHIENAAQADADPETNTFYATITLGAKTIRPNQTVLVVSRSGESSHPNSFAPTRVVNLWTTRAHKEALEMTSSRDQVLSTLGFSIELVDKDGKSVDRVGNLDGMRHTRDQPAWTIPMSDDPESRSSMLRIYDQKVALDGTMEKAWRLASDAILAAEDSHAYYGSADDVGTPGFRDGGPLPVSLSKFRPERLKDTGEVVVRWITESELNNAGFNILRSEKRDGEFTKVHFEAGQGTTSERTVYEWKDKTAKPNVVYYYQIQDVSMDGDVTPLRITHLRGNVTAAGKLTTTWGEIKALQ